MRAKESEQTESLITVHEHSEKADQAHATMGNVKWTAHACVCVCAASARQSSTKKRMEEKRSSVLGDGWRRKQRIDCSAIIQNPSICFDFRTGFSAVEKSKINICAMILEA